jgi:hypothetical protein
MKISVAVGSTTGQVKRATVELWSEKNPSLKLQLYTYYHEDIEIMEKLIAEGDGES